MPGWNRSPTAGDFAALSALVAAERPRLAADEANP